MPLNNFFMLSLLPVLLFIFYASGQKYREYILAGASISFCILADPAFGVLFFCVFLNVVLGAVMKRKSTGTKVKRLLVCTGIVFDAAVLLFYKYCGIFFTADQIKSSGFLESIAVPVGFSFITFKEISYLADVNKGKISPEERPVKDVLYILFFPQLVSGPISRCSDMSISADRSEILTNLSEGVQRFTVGFSKKVLLSDMLANITGEVFSADINEISCSYAWLGALCYSLELYYDFSGYSDMAIGVSRMFGIGCPENFDFPYTTPSFSKFWRKWHITLGAWFRDYIYIPMGGSRCKNKARVYLNLFIVWTVTGIWHGSTLNFLVWGAAYFALISFEKLTGLPDRLNSGILKALYRIAVIACIVFLWVIFRITDVTDGFSYIWHMIAPGGDHISEIRTMILLKDYSVIIACAVVFCLPADRFIKGLIGEKSTLEFVYEAIKTAAGLLLFLVSVSFVVSGQYNPFAYANF